MKGVFGWVVTFGKAVVSCGLCKNNCEKNRKPFGWTTVIFYQKTVKRTHISSTIIPMRPSRGREAAWGGRGASTTMRAGTRAHQSRAVHPPDKACGALVGGEVRGTEEVVARGRREWSKKRTQTGILHNQWQVGNLYVQKPVKVGENAFGSVLVKSWLWKKMLPPGRSKTNFRRL